MPDMTCPVCGEPSDTHHVRWEMTPPLPPVTWEDGASSRPIDIDAVMAEVATLLPATLTDDLRTRTTVAIRAELVVENLLRGPRPIADEEWDPAVAQQTRVGLAWRKAMYRVGLAHGCDCCLLHPEARTRTEANLARAAFDTAWDGDPAELYI